MTAMIKNMQGAVDYANKSNVKLIGGYSLERKNGSKECVAFFHAKKSAGELSSNVKKNRDNEHEEYTFTNRNITLWNNIDHSESAFTRGILRVLYVMSIFFLLPIADWLIGYLRSDQELVSMYKFNTDPTNPTKSIVIKYETVNDYKAKTYTLQRT